MEEMRAMFSLPEEPVELKLQTRSLLEESPGEGAELIADAAFLADVLWEEWGEELQSVGMERGRFVEISRGYAGEIRLWVVGERPWEHCASGLAGRVRRRLVPPGPGKTQVEETLVCSEVS